MKNYQLSQAEQAFQQKIKTNVVFLRLTRREGEAFGQRAHGPTVYEISELFTKFGDINIVKNTPFSCYLELQDVDKDVVEDTLSCLKVQILEITTAGKRSAHKSKYKQTQPM